VWLDDRVWGEWSKEKCTRVQGHVAAGPRGNWAVGLLPGRQSEQATRPRGEGGRGDVGPRRELSPRATGELEWLY
jgi:hypothetical protein